MSFRPELSSLRGLSALWVFAFHTTVLSVAPHYLSSWPVIGCGYLGVAVFFILSISLLLTSLDKNPSLKHYFWRRVKRIWPMYFATVLIVFFVEAHNISWLAEQMSFSAVFYDNIGIQYVFWSLQVEEVAYLFFPYIHGLSKETQFRLGYALWLIAIAAMIPIAWGWNYATLEQWWWVPLTLSSYGMGILVYQKRVSSVFLPLILLGFFYWSNLIFNMASCLVVPGFAYVVQESYRYKWLQWGPFVQMGDISYGLYLVHYLLLVTLGWLGFALAIPAAYALEKANRLGIKGAGRLYVRLRA